MKNARVVISTSTSDFHRMTVTNKNCPVKCDCKRFSDLGLCAHIIAVAYDEGKLNEVVRNYKPNISAIVQPSGKAGKNPNQSVRKRKSSTTKGKRSVAEFNDPLAHTDLINFPDPDNWTVVFVKNTKMRKCYGCGGSVRQDVSVVPPSPWNIVLARREYRAYTPRGKRSIQISAKKEMVYYHPRMKCLREKNTDVTGNRVQVPSDIALDLDDLQRAQLRKEFGIDL
ncbi:Mitogen-activated kinase kinase kinase A [Paramuricea clavata]|uniref:Mitogen-activated kinase kinase kinase A n=1 Tax=Paramuricea clavata TaxID=317549 RepID=A0A6S7HCP9_PARCT|nr:Mitogen-activated kinase kinase kinase A [Paramuricea clavata]